MVYQIENGEEEVRNLMGGGKRETESTRIRRGLFGLPQLPSQLPPLLPQQHPPQLLIILLFSCIYAL